MRHNCRKVRNFYTFTIIRIKWVWNKGLLVVNLFISMRIGNSIMVLNLSCSFFWMIETIYISNRVTVFYIIVNISYQSLFRVKEETCTWRTLNNSWPQGIINIKDSFFLQLHVCNRTGISLTSVNVRWLSHNYLGTVLYKQRAISTKESISNDSVFQTGFPVISN